MNAKIIELKQVKKYFHLSRHKVLKAVDNINIDIYSGETFGLVGESGCGKSTLGRTIKGIYKPTAGQVIFPSRMFRAAAGPGLFRMNPSSPRRASSLQQERVALQSAWLLVRPTAPGILATQ